MSMQRRLTFLLLCTLLAALLVACGGPAPAELPTPSPIPTAQIVSRPSPDAAIVLPTSLSSTAQPTAPPLPTPAAQPPVHTAAPLRSGPGGLPYPLRLDRLNFGVVGHLYYTDRYTALTRTREAGFGWFRQQIHWRDIEDRSGQFFWNELDNIVADVNSQGLLLMINVTRSPSWHTANGGDGLPQDPATLARFLGALTQRYQGRVHAIKIWNEQNLAYENGGEVTAEDAGHFVELMAASYNAIKAVDPSVIVVAGAPASTATNIPSIAMDSISYLEAMYRYRDGMLRDYFDVQALHPGGSANPPETLYPDNPSSIEGCVPAPDNCWNTDPSFYYRHLENQRRVMEEHGMGQHQVWVTEYGWATRNNSPGYEFGNLISYETQADYIVGAIRYTHEHYPWVSNMFLWNLNFTVLQRESGVNPWHEQGSFSIVNADWTPRPAYLAVQATISEIKAQQAP
jgi:hypothetical protein